MVSRSASVNGGPCHDPVAHVGLVRSINPVLAEVTQRAAETIEAFLAVAALKCPIIHVVAEFHIRIERARRLTPAKRYVAAEIGTQHVADEQRVGIETIRRERAEFILPLADDAAGSQFERDEAEGCHLITLSAAVRKTSSGIVFVINNPCFPER
jgi:hypothetical protein